MLRPRFGRLYIPLSVKTQGWGGGSQPAYAIFHFSLYNSKIEVFETYFFDTAITLNDYTRYISHVLGRIYVFFTLFGYWALLGGGGGQTGLVLTQFFNVYCSKIEVSQNLFFWYCDHLK